ncbi:hypothetical protein BDF22DRAFT_655323 [Syncephalis plumigaleata]|nr:hypothetical protein BDF22DRAFT_655323 [Syncephalis plumigaleata]
MFYGMTIYLIFIIIFGVITQFYADTSTPSSWMTEGRCVYFDWSILLCACLVGFILVILMPCLLFTLCKINDTYGIRRGLVMVLLFSTLGLIVYITLKYAVQVKEYGGFRSVHVIIPVILFNHMVLICWPLYLLRNALPHHYHQAQGNKLPRSRSNNSNVECGRPGIKSSVQYDTSYISRDLFRQLLNDPNRVDSFKRYTVRDLSVENILFYEACQAILTTSSSPRNTLAYQAEHATLQRRMSMLHSTFLEANSDLEVNLTEETLHRLAECLGMDIAYGDSAAYATLADSVRAAQEEILELMFFDTYPRYLNSTCQNDEPILDEQCLGKYSTDTQEFTLAVQALAQSESQTSTFYLLDRYK